MPLGSPIPKLRKPRRRQKWHRAARYVYLKVSRLRASPAEIARGFAAGTFTGMMPLFGIQTIFAIALATLVRGNPFAAALTTWVSNPITFVPLYMINFRMGQALLGTQNLMLSLRQGMTLTEISQIGLACLVTLTVGCIATGIPAAIVSYFLGLQLARRWQQRRDR